MSLRAVFLDFVYLIHQFEKALPHIFMVFMGSILNVITVLQDLYSMEQERAYRNLNIHLSGPGKYSYCKAEVSTNVSLSNNK